MMNPDETRAAPPNRREFLKKAATILIGAAAFVPVLGAGLALILDPLRSRGGQTRWTWVASLGGLSTDGTPRKFSVMMDREDAWNRMSNVPVGAVYLRRTGERVQALNAVCPHAGCFVAMQGDAYRCPCHDSLFRLDGTIKDASSPSPRPLDELQSEVRNGSEIWVKFQNFQAGKAEKVPVG